MDIIILERTKELGDTLSLLLLTFGLKGIPVCTAEEALQALQQYPGINFGIIDIDNRSTGGIRFIKQVRQDKQYKGLKIIVHTAQKVKQIQSKMAHMSVLGSITKPFEETKTLQQLKEILSKIYFSGTEKRCHIRIKPDPGELARVHFLLQFYPDLLYGKILDISMAGMAVELLKPPPRPYLKEGARIPQLIFSLDCKQIKASGIIKLERGKIIVLQFYVLGRKAKRAIAKYIFKRISVH